MKRTEFNWILSFPGIWYTKEGHVLYSLNGIKAAPFSYGWYEFEGKEFIARGCFEAQLHAERLLRGK